MELQLFNDAYKLDLSPQQLTLIERFVGLFVEANQQLNLSAIKSREELLKKHIYDALLADSLLDLGSGQRVADLGTGGGLPGLVLAILHPDSEFVLVDSVGKKIEAVKGFISKLGLENVTAVSERLEALGRDPDYRERFDLVLARALAPMPTLLEYAAPLVQTGGRFVAMKGPGYLEEIADADVAIRLLKLPMPTVERYELPEGDGKRYLVFFEKKKPVPNQYPRRVGVPKKHPL